MPVQPQLFPDPPAVVPVAPAIVPAGPAPPPAERTPALVLWMQRISLVILVFFCVDVGVIMTYLPWWTAVWDHNLFFAAHPALGEVMRKGVVRGLVSGIGVVDIWIGISEAVHYRER